MAEKRSKSVDYRSTFKTENGKKVLLDLNKYCFGSKSYIDTSKKLRTNADGTTIIGVSPVDPLEIARFEGRREVLLYILKQIKMDNIDIIDEFIDGDIEGF
jgi:hypothetical protein